MSPSVVRMLLNVRSVQEAGTHSVTQPSSGHWSPNGFSGVMAPHAPSHGPSSHAGST